MAVDSAPEGVTLRLFDRLGQLPFYNEDLDNDTDSAPEPVRALRAAAGSADAALVITPEYNGSIPRRSRTQSTGCRDPGATARSRTSR